MSDQPRPDAPDSAERPNAAVGTPDSAGTAADWDQIVDSFEATYGRVYASSARSPELGFSITGAILPIEGGWTAH